MSWSIEEHIGEGRPWPEQVVVYRGETDESLTYARRSLSDVNKMVELMDTLAAENAKLRELLLDVWNDAMQFDGFWDYVNDDGEIYNEDELPHYYDRMRELGIEVN